MPLRPLLLALLALAALLVPPRAEAQAYREGLLQIGDDLARFLERQHTAGRLPGAHLSHQPLSAYDARALLDSLHLREDELSPVERALLRRFRGEEPGPGVALARRLASGLYANGLSPLAASGDGYDLEATPLAYLALGLARQTALDEREPTATVWQNTRGARLAGRIGEHVFFETRLEENQARVARPAAKGGTAPRLAGIKLERGGQVYDYWNAMGIVGLRTRFFEARLGRDRNRWGFGTNSLALSGYAPAYDQIQLRTSVWRLQYTNLFARFTDSGPKTRGALPIRPQKYGVLHRLALDLPARVQLEFFEAVVFVADSTEAGYRSGFELAYLNPIIFYRAVEFDLGSPDNVLLGAGASWIATPGVKLYGQLILDEFAVRRIREDWWGNKWGWMLGLHLAPAGRPNLDVRLEASRLRPFLYSHETSASAFVHFRDGLGHAAGPNAMDFAAFLHAQPRPELQAALTLAFTRRGRAPEGQNVGADPNQPYTTRDRERDFSTTTLQGIREDRLLVEARAAYELLPSLFAEVGLRAESTRDAERGLDRYVAPFASLRWGLPFPSVRY